MEDMESRKQQPLRDAADVLFLRRKAFIQFFSEARFDNHYFDSFTCLL